MRWRSIIIIYENRDEWMMFLLYEIRTPNWEVLGDIRIFSILVLVEQQKNLLEFEFLFFEFNQSRERQRESMRKSGERERDRKI